MRRRAQIPRDALHPFADRAGDHTDRRRRWNPLIVSRIAGGLLVRLGAQLVGGGIADRLARLLRVLLRLEPLLLQRLEPVFQVST